MLVMYVEPFPSCPSFGVDATARALVQKLKLFITREELREMIFEDKKKKGTFLGGATRVLPRRAPSNPRLSMLLFCPLIDHGRFPASIKSTGLILLTALAPRSRTYHVTGLGKITLQITPRFCPREYHVVAHL